MAKVLVWLELLGGEIAPVALEALGKARELAQPGGLQAVLIGAEPTAALAEAAIHYGADVVFVVTSPCLALYQSEAYPQIFAQIAVSASPDAIIVGSSPLGMDLAPSVAALLSTGLTAHCVELTIEDGQKETSKPLLKQTVPGWGGNMLVTIICPTAMPQMATICPGAFAAAKRDVRRLGQIINWQVNITNLVELAHTVGSRENEAESSLSKAEIVVAGGFGMLAAGGFALLEDLAAVLGGAVGGTRAALDQGWINGEQLIGQSGSCIAPQLLIVAGAAGATHFTTGFKDAQTVIAINKNPHAPIFMSADFGVVGDVSQILPALLTSIKSLRRVAN